MMILVVVMMRRAGWLAVWVSVLRNWALNTSVFNENYSLLVIVSIVPETYQRVISSAVFSFKYSAECISSSEMVST